MAEWRVYGCGSASSNRSLQSSYEFADEDVRLHVDLGNGAIYQRCRAEGGINAALDSMTQLLITHGHHDHTVDLARHVVAWKYTPGYSPGKPVQLYITEPALAEVKHLLDSSGFKGIFEEIYVPQIIQPGQPFSVGHLAVTPFNVEHKDGSVGIRIEIPDGPKVAFTSDTCRFDGLHEHLKDQDLLVTEASFFDSPHIMHLTLQEAAELARDACAKNLLLVHFYPDMEEKTDEEIRQHAAQWFSGNVYSAHDGMALTWDANAKSWGESKMF